METQTGVLLLAIVSTLLVVMAGTGKLLLPSTSRKAVESGKTALWKAACFASQLFFWSLIVLVLQWVLVFILKSGVLESDIGAFFASAVLLSIPLGIALARGQAFWDGYWQCIRSSLKTSTGAMTREQSTTFKEQHKFLIVGLGDERKSILAKILKREGPDRMYFSDGDSLPDALAPKARQDSASKSVGDAASSPAPTELGPDIETPDVEPDKSPKDP